MDIGEQIILLGSLGLVAASFVASLWLLVQAFLDQKALKIAGRNGPLRTLARVAITQEAVRVGMLLVLLVLFILVTAFAEEQFLTLRRALLIAAMLLIAFGSIHSNVARRLLGTAITEDTALKEAVAKELAAKTIATAEDLAAKTTAAAEGVDAQLQEIHSLVNSEKTAAHEAELIAIEAHLATLRRIASAEPTEVELRTIADLEARASVVRGMITGQR